MASENCPQCKRKGGLSTSYSILITMENWPDLLVVLGAVLSFAIWLRIGAYLALASAFAAAIPLYVRLLKRQYCDRCRMEFRVEDTQEIHL